MDSRDWQILKEWPGTVRMIEQNTFQRNSRRTLGQVRLAVIKAFSGRRVYYMCATKESAEYSFRMALDSCTEALNGMAAIVRIHDRTVEFPGFGGSVSFRVALPELRGTGPNVEVHVDHWAQEQRP